MENCAWDCMTWLAINADGGCVRCCEIETPVVGAGGLGVRYCDDAMHRAIEDDCFARRGNEVDDLEVWHVWYAVMVLMILVS